MKEIETDLSGRHRIIVVSPCIPNVKSQKEIDLNRLFSQTRYPYLRHVCSLEYDGWDEKVKEFKTCDFQLMKNKNFSSFDCESSSCKVDLSFSIEKDIENILMFLMIKQIIPSMEFLNFIDFNSHEKQEIRNLGLVSVSKDFFNGTLTGKRKTAVSLGFSFQLDDDLKFQWSSILFEKYINLYVKETIRDIEKLSKQNLLGPKP